MLIDAPCGKCIECARRYSSAWALRIMLEAKRHEQNCVLTLTYDDVHKPDHDSLCKRDMQLFFKRLRKDLEKRDIRIRYYYSGEYGELQGRPHYHCIIFGWIPEDLMTYKKSARGNDQYFSPYVSDKWGKGIVTVGELDERTAFYCAKYLQKSFKIAGKDQIPPFSCMSRRPGIGAGCISYEDIACGYIYVKGRKIPVDRYFLETIRETDPDVYFGLKAERERLRVNHEARLDETKTDEDLYNKRLHENDLLGKARKLANHIYNEQQPDIFDEFREKDLEYRREMFDKEGKYGVLCTYLTDEEI